jgi:prephenate dehydratase
MAFRGCDRLAKPEIIVDAKSRIVFIHTKKDDLKEFDLIRSHAQFINFCDQHELSDFKQAVIARGTSGPGAMNYAKDNGIVLIIAQDSAAEELIAKAGVSNLRRY